MKRRTKIRSFVLAAIVGLLLFGCYAQGPEIQPSTGDTPAQQDPSKPKPKPTATPTPEKPSTQQDPSQQQG